ncbi:MAG: aldehyde dehydrogenase [Oscillospiraceae bacterium]|mgnify:CR=1 FL=1|nr:aldehyde dehydrogenase [Oscillospiraceae bacterium]
MLFKMYINGAWHEGAGERRDVVSPINGEVLGQLCMGSAADVDLAVRGAVKALEQLSNMTVFQRAELLYRISDAILARKEQLAELLVREHGKIYAEALGEVCGSAGAFRECGDQIKWLPSEIVPCREGERLCMVLRRPKGVFGIITPWNFPLGTPSMYYLAPGLAAGCPMVWNPATSTAAVASAFMQCFADAEVPAGFVSLVIGKGSVVGDALSVHPQVAGIGFTGSTATGNTICSRAQSKHTQMELGGNGPCIVLKDADLDLAADKLMAGSFTNAGQICTSTERVLVDNAVADLLVYKIKSRMDRYVLGDPFQAGVTVGPMHAQDTIETVLRHIDDAAAKGAEVVCGGGRAPGMPTDHYIQPTVLDHVRRDALVNVEETFGPVLPLVRFRDESEIPAIIRDSPYRLFSAIFTRDVDKALTMAQSCDFNFGCVNINEGSSFWDTMLPAGGGGGSASGHGRSGGKYSIADFSEERLVAVNLRTGRR